jgi:phage-related protein
MALPTFNPSVAPSPGTTRKPEISLNKSQFGDGYTQASPKGINHIRMTMELKWEGLTPAQVAELEAFFVERAGYKSFKYRHFSETVTRKWTCGEWSASFAAPCTFSASIREDFSLQS